MFKNDRKFVIIDENANIYSKASNVCRYLDVEFQARQGWFSETSRASS